MKLDIQILQNNGSTDTESVTVKLAGSLDTSTAPELENQLKNVFSHPKKDLIFDLTDLKFISSAGLRVFAIARKVMKENSGETHFINMQPQIQAVFEIIKSLPGVTVFKDMPEFDAYLAARQRSFTDKGR
ncbi:MAG TPA: STAS domain-containing protein [Leptospiraceae bacterium]|nr:STAS domain-containing protein [Leptospiraceae bacterium]HMZ61836.1 STAS domain-containing protein [Leptospiraceae bacterium]HNF13108.1 STAS domain-containing protein [Leptospiraceae bacterium]HNF25319.1 STAS domain-containing protein [Leptospiraceae bacterium]HNH07237.1 STAS domain-containing protein [Leptospiraceae bacterium]